MECEFISLSETENGQILKCGKCKIKICLMYKNIVQGLWLEDFYKLKNSLSAIDIEKYFLCHPEEKRIHIRTRIKDMFFAFTHEEFEELKELISQAELKIKIYENIQNNYN